MNQENLSPERRDLLGHLRNNAVRTGERFVLRSGAESTWYVDARQTTFDGLGARLVGRAVLDAMVDGVDAVGGMTMGADPIAIATAVAATDRGGSAVPLRAFSIRKEVKDHGTGGRLVGPVVRGDRVVILEDTTTTGGAFFEAVDVAVESGLEVVQAIALVDRSNGVVTTRMADRGIPYTPLIGSHLLEPV